MTSVISRVFMNGNSQAVRIPQEFSRNVEGDLVIRAIPADRGAALLQALQAFDDTLADDLGLRLAEDRLDQRPPQERDVL